MVMAQSLFKVLRAAQPDVQIDVLAPAWSLPVIDRMPEVRKGIALPAAHGELAIGTRRRLGTDLKANNYDQAIVLPRSMKAALVPWFARIGRRTGYRGEMRYGLINDMRPFDRKTLDQTVKRFVGLALDSAGELPVIPRPELDVSAANQRTLTGRLGLDTSMPMVAFMPGAEYGPAKCWPMAYFQELARHLADRGFVVLVLGSDKDQVAGESIASGSGARNLCGETRIDEVIDILALCRAAVTNDSGLMHVAAAVGARVIAIYGSTSPAFTPPLTDNKVVHYLGLECSPCFQRQCPLEHLRCLRDIRPVDVLESITVT